MKVAVHITHEAVQKIGGIGSVIHGLCTADNYRSFFQKTLLYGPLFSLYSNDVFSKLGKGGTVLYSNHDNYDKGEFNSLFLPILNKYNIDIVYGKRTIVDEFNVNKNNTVDIVLVAIHKMNLDVVNTFKFKLWEAFGIESDRYNSWDFEQYLRIAIPYLEIIYKLYPEAITFYHFSHEYMGVASVLSVLIDRKSVEHKTIFYTHEISPCRDLVEKNPGHDISFYNTMYMNLKKGIHFEEQYGNQQNNYRAELIKRTNRLDYIFAVSDLIKDEYRYFVKDSIENRIKIVYNGIPVRYITGEDKLRSRKNLQEYIATLFNFTPDIIFTHVTRLVLSKGIWRDITFLYILDEIFHQYGLKGCYILLSTLIGTGREPSYIYSMEKEYGWPVIHREGWPDLVGAEIDIYNYLSLFNARSKNIKGIFINQFGFDRRRCGLRVPEGSEFADIRIGSDTEFGYSIYEPFGISQLETIPYGGIASLSTSCGSSFMLQKEAKKLTRTIFHLLDFIGKAKEVKLNTDISSVTADDRFQYERKLFQTSGADFFNILPRNDQERLRGLKNIQEHLYFLSWEESVNSMELSKL